MNEKRNLTRVSFLLLPVLTLAMLGCSDNKDQSSGKKLVYFGYQDHSEAQDDVIKLSETWGSKVCPHWEATLNEKNADYKVLFGPVKVTLVGSKGEILYDGGSGPLYLPHGNSNGTGVNICKLTGESK